MSSSRTRSFNYIIHSRIERVRPLLLKIFSQPEWFLRQWEKLVKNQFPRMLGSGKKRKFFLQILLDVGRETWKNKCLPFHYFHYELYLKKNTNRKMAEYIPDTVFYYRDLAIFNQDWLLLDDKNIFHDILPSSIPQPMIVAKKREGVWRQGNNAAIETSHLYDFLVNSKITDFICKPGRYSSAGSDVFAIEVRGTNLYLNGDLIARSDLISLFEGDWLIQKRLYNISEIQHYNKYALNCTRFLTVQDRHGVSKVIYAVQKFATKDGLTDNGKNGLVYAKIDLSTGKLGQYAYNGKNERFDIHPGTKLRYNSLILRDLDVAINLCEEAANYFPKCKIIGWDVAFTTEGVVLIEGNSSPALAMLQISHQGGLELKKYLDEHRLLFKSRL